MPNQHDLLLVWLSTLGRVSEGRVRQAEQQVGPDRYGHGRVLETRLDELCRAGHVEHKSGCWRVVATTLVWRRGCGELYGARDPALAEEFVSAELELTRIEGELGAEVWRVTGDRLAAEAVCERLAIRFEDDRSERLLAALPAARDALCAIGPLVRRSPLTGRSWQRFHDTGRWGPEKPRGDLEQGLWRSRSPRPFVYLWLDENGTTRRLDRAEHLLLARWVVVAAEVRLSAGAISMSVPQYPRLPVLLDRALRIAGGGEVRRHGREYWYPGIDAGRAAQVARILGISLQQVDSV
jgi:hypothetical protein